MLRDIVQNTTVQLRAWLDQKNFESKVKTGQTGTFTQQTAPVGREDEAEKLLFSRTELLYRGPKNGGIGPYSQSKQVTTYTPQDDVARHFLTLRDKIDKIRKLQELLGDIADELTDKYAEITRRDTNGRSAPTMVVALSPEALTGKPRGDRNARRLRLGLPTV
jgi:hypothetical protein